MRELPSEALGRIAEYFQALAEPTRLQILNFLRDGERRVGDIAEHCGCTAANISRHLALLSKQGLVARAGRGTSVYYSISDPAIDALCALVCDRIACRLMDMAKEGEAFRRAPEAGAGASHATPPVLPVS